jgi:FkbM family methyltransferase
VGQEGRVVSFEASPYIFESLVQNIRRNPVDNVRAVNVAVTAVPGSVTVYPGPPKNCGATNILGTRPTDKAEPAQLNARIVDSRPLDELLSGEEKQRVRLIKIDVEGVELDVIQGMRAILTSGRRDLEIVVEVTPTADPTRSQEQIFRLFRDSGFHPYLIPRFPYYEPPPYRIERPRRLRVPVVSTQSDILFSRRDAETL